MNKVVEVPMGYSGRCVIAHGSASNALPAALRFCAGFYIVSLFLVEANIPDGTSRIGNLSLLIAGFISLFCILLYWKRMARSFVFSSAHGFILLCSFALCAFSLFWSVDTAATIEQVALLASMILCTQIAVSLGAAFMMRLILNIAVLLAILSLCVIPIASDFAWQPHWSTSWPELRGVFRHQQRLGLFMCLAAGLAILAKMNAWDELFDRGMLKRFWLVVALFVLLIVMSFARLYMVYAMVSLIIVFSLSLGWLSRFVLALLCLVLGFIFIPTLVGTLEFSLPGNAVSASSDLTLAGRTVIWERSLSLIAERPLGGYGFGVFDAPYFDWMWGAYRAPHAHNSFIQAAFDLGLLGVLMTGGLVLAHIRRASNLAFHPGRYHMAMFVVLLCVLASLTGVTYAGKPSLMMGIVLIVVSFGGRECSNQPKLDHCAFGSGK